MFVMIISDIGPDFYGTIIIVLKSENAKERYCDNGDFSTSLLRYV